jgi:pSer/pThr/pTyr-binding forkhead associated (FHA) protein
VYDKDDIVKHQPLVYVRDLQSTSGTRVNGRLIGSKDSGITPGYLLGQGDTITVHPYWEFEVCLFQKKSSRLVSSSSLTAVQRQEAKVNSSTFNFIVQRSK